MQHTQGRHIYLQSLMRDTLQGSLQFYPSPGSGSRLVYGVLAGGFYYQPFTSIEDGLMEEPFYLLWVAGFSSRGYLQYAALFCDLFESFSPSEVGSSGQVFPVGV